MVNWLDRDNPQAGGAEAHLHETFGRIARQGHSVTLLCSGWKGCPPRATLDGIDIHRVGRRYTFSLYAHQAFRRLAAAGPFDVVVEDLNKVPLFTPRWSHAPVLLLVHHLFGLTAFQEANPLLASATWILERPIPRVFRGLRTVAISESTREDLIGRGLAAEDVTVIPNGIDLEFYAPDPEVAPFAVPTVLFMGRVKRYKRVDLVLRALARIREGGCEARLLVAGRGDHLEAMTNLAGRLGVADAVEFLGFVSEERKRELLRRSWVHVLTSPKEGWGISNLEAAACGTPTVASDSPGLRESVVHGRTGYLVPHGDVEILADRLRQLLEDGPEREVMGELARDFAARFSWDATAERMLDILGEVARSPGHA